MEFRELLNRDKEEASKLQLEGHQATIWTGLPCIVSSFDPVNVTVEAVPAIQGLIKNKDGSQSFKTITKLVDVPVVFQRGGGYTSTFPVAAGDECFVVFSSRCIDGWWASGDITPPNDLRMHDLSDGFAFVGPFSQKTRIQNVSTTTAQFRSDDGKVFVELDKNAGLVRVKAPTQVTIDTPVTIFTGVTVVQNSGGQDVAAEVLGKTVATGDVVALGDVIAGNVSERHHTHLNSGGTGVGGPPVGG